MRLACSSDGSAPTRRPRRLAVTARAAIALGMLLLLAAVVLAARGLMAAPAASGEEGGQTGEKQTVSAFEQEDAAGSEAAPSGTAADGPAASEAEDLAPLDPLGQPSSAGARVTVHVAGAVAAPGVVTLAAGARVGQAVEAAGGALEEADLDQLNLARVLEDGEQVRVPRVGEDASAWVGGASGSAGAGSGTRGGSGASASRSGGRAEPGSGTGVVNINRADAAELETLPGIGPALAERIVAYRAKHGSFASVEQLTEVPGIGQAKLASLRERVTV